MTTLKPVDRWAGQDEEFNRDAAEVVFKRMMAMEDAEALVFGRIVVAESLQRDLIEHREVIGKALDARFAKRAEIIKGSLMRTAVAKTRAGEDPSTELGALVQLAKADDRDLRSEYARRQHRDHGRFAEGHVKIGYDSKVKPLPDAHAKHFGIEGSGHLSGDDKARFQQAYQQIADLVAPYRGLGDQALLHVNVEDKAGKLRTHSIPVPSSRSGAHLGLNSEVKSGDTVRSAHITVAPGTGFSGATYDTLAALGAPRAGATLAGAANGGALDPERLGQFNDELDRTFDQEEYVPSRRLFHRLEHGSKLLQDSLGDSAPRKVQYALAVGQHVGQYGPEAQKVIGPTADRTAYRYRGTERTPDHALGRTLEAIRRDPELKTAAAKREQLLHGELTTRGWEPSGPLAYFRGKLPKADLNTLQLKSGNVPPSQGIIINRSGAVAHQSVGYGDDWYLPFNLKNLKALKGGEYIRTRTYGGPTTEDIYTGLISGARGMTVVSHNGVYTVDFDDTLRGGRRFNDKAARMVARYGQLLDAVKSGQVETGGLDPARLGELRDKAARTYDPVTDKADFENEFRTLQAKERLNPELSQAQRNTAGVEFLNELAAKRTTRDGHTMTAADLTDELVGTAAAKGLAGHVEGARQFGVAPVRDLAQYRAEEETKLQGDTPAATAANVAGALGQGRQFDAYMKQTQEQYARSLQPLKLDGQGYALALTALQEQFPYYIARVEFHPWDDARNGRDTGYIKPRHNRPAEALSGYFDTSISRNGGGKVGADSTRFQNRNNRVRPVGQKAARPESDETTTGEARPAAHVSSEVSARLQANADRALFAEIKRQTTFGPSIIADSKYPGLKGLANEPVAAIANSPEFTPVAPNLARLLGMSESDFDRDYEARPEELHGLLRSAHGEVKTRKLFDLNRETERTFEAGGRAESARDLPSDKRRYLSSLDAEHNFPGAAYGVGRDPDVATVQAAYGDDPRVGDLIASGKLPRDLSASDFDQRSQALAGELRQLDSELTRKESRGDHLTTAERHSIEGPSEGLARARQLRRRFQESLTRKVEVASNGTTAPATLEENHLHLPPPTRQPHESPGDYAETLKVWHSFVQGMNKPGVAEPTYRNDRTIDAP